VEILKEGEAGLPVAGLLRKHGISRATYFQWKAKYSGATVADFRRLKELEAENSKLKRLYSELALENAALRVKSLPKNGTLRGGWAAMPT
jgi:putative transposase